MKNKFKITAIAVLLLLSLTLGSCGRLSADNGDSATKPQAATTTAVQSTDEAIFSEASMNFTSTVLTLSDNTESKSTKLVSGYDFAAVKPTTADFKKLENLETSDSDSPVPTTKQGVHYTYTIQKKTNADGSSSFEFCEFFKFDGSMPIWSIKIKDFEVSNYRVTEDAIIVYGNDSSIQGTCGNAFLMKLDTNGNILWKYKTDFEFNNEWVIDVLDIGGNYIVFLRGDASENPTYSIRFVLSYDGEMTARVNTNVPLTTLDLRLCDEGYFDLSSTQLKKLDYYGNTVSTLKYESDTHLLRIRDAIELDGKFYFSADAWHKDAGNILANAVSEGAKGSALADKVREVFSAMLLVCDAKTGEVISFYVMDGAIGCDLSFGSTGEILWDVGNVTTAYYSPQTSAFCYNGSCYVYRITLDYDDKPTNREKLDEIVSYAW